MISQSEIYSTTEGVYFYSYALNNPLIFTDPDGEFIHLIIGAIIGGDINLWINRDNIDNFWHGLGYFGVSAAAGALSAGIGAGVNVAIAGGSFGAGFLGTAAGVSSTGFFAGAATGAATGFTNGLITGTGNAALNGSSFTESLGSGFNAAWKQGAIGDLSGGIFGGIHAASKDVNFFTGKANFDITEGVGAHGIPKDLKMLKAKYVGDFDGVNMYESTKLGTGYGSGGVTLPGKGIIVGKNTFSRAADMGLVHHEFGHILQSRITGKFSTKSVIAYGRRVDYVNLCENQEINLFFINEDTLRLNSWAEICAYQKFDKRIKLSLDELKQRDWVVFYSN